MSATIPAATGAAGPPFAPCRPWLDAATFARGWPAVDALDAAARKAGLVLPDGRPLRFVPVPERRTRALDYERRIAERGEIATRRANLHDVANALAWLAFPRTKAALNRRHVDAGTVASPNARDRVRDAATLLDESGLLFACADASIAAGLREHRWRATFGERREDVERSVHPLAIGHGLLVKLLAPFPALTAKALVVPLDAGALPVGADAVAVVDAAAAAIVADERFGPASLLPLPVAALPGWPGDDGSDERFDDLRVFRPPRVARQPSFASAAATTAGSASGRSANASAPASSSALP